MTRFDGSRLWGLCPACYMWRYVGYRPALTGLSCIGSTRRWRYFSACKFRPEARIDLDRDLSKRPWTVIVLLFLYFPRWDQYLTTQANSRQEDHSGYKILTRRKAAITIFTVSHPHTIKSMLPLSFWVCDEVSIEKRDIHDTTGGGRNIRKDPGIGKQMITRLFIKSTGKLRM